MFLIFGADAAGKIHDVNAYLTFLSFLSGSFILGYSGSETMKLFKSESTEQEVNQTQTVSQNVNERISEEYVEKTPRPRDADDGTLD